MEFDGGWHRIRTSPLFILVLRTFPFALGLGGKSAGNEINPRIFIYFSLIYVAVRFLEF